MSKKTPRCYIDANVIIDYVAFEYGAGIPSQRQIEMDYVEKIFNHAKDGSILLFSSSISKVECHSIGKDTLVTDDVKKLFSSILGSGKVVRPISPIEPILEMARDMQWDGFPLPGNMDKIHIASAIFSKCTEFITFDGFRREYYKRNHLDDFACIEELCKAHNISVVYPSETFVAQKEYALHVRELLKKKKREEDERKKQKWIALPSG
ncbi:hypothetical protein [Humidesulfovibrio sp.]